MTDAEPWLRYEDEDVLVVEKPEGVLSQRAEDHGQEGMLEWVQRRRPQLTLSAIRRVAKPEGGLVVLAATEAGRRTAVTQLDGGAIRLDGGTKSSDPVEIASHQARPVDASTSDPSHRARAALARRTVLLDPATTDAHVWIDRHHDGFPERRVERLGSTALVIDRSATDGVDRSLVDALGDVAPLDGVFWMRRTRTGPSRPAERVSGSSPSSFAVVEDGNRFLVDMDASATSTGLFLDQRETRHTLRRLDLQHRTALNTFAHTGSLSVAAALAGAETLTFDLSKHYLDWARRNFELNGLDPADHDFMYGDAMEWLTRFDKRGRRFDVVIADPPSTSTPRSRRGERWVAARDLWLLVERAVRVTAGGGTVFVSTNLRKMTWPQFLDHVDRGLAGAGRTAAVTTTTVPIDFRTGPDDPPHLKGAWLAMDTG